MLSAPSCLSTAAMPPVSTQAGAACVDKAQSLRPRGWGQQGREARRLRAFPSTARPTPRICEDGQGSRGGQGLADPHHGMTPGLTGPSQAPGGHCGRAPAQMPSDG